LQAIWAGQGKERIGGGKDTSKNHRFINKLGLNIGFFLNYNNFLFYIPD
jgi:hypothetical protein